MSTRAERRIQEFQRAVNQDLHDDAAQAQANQIATNAPTPPQRVVILDGTRGRLGGDATAIVGAWTEVARFQNRQSKPITIQSNVGTMLALTAAGPPPVYAPLPDLQGKLVSQPAPTVYPRVMLRIQTGSGNEGGGASTGVYFHPAGDAFEVTGTQIFISAQILFERACGVHGVGRRSRRPHGARSYAHLSDQRDDRSRGSHLGDGNEVDSTSIQHLFRGTVLVGGHGSRSGDGRSWTNQASAWIQRERDHREHSLPDVLRHYGARKWGASIWGLSTLYDSNGRRERPFFLGLHSQL